MGLQIFHSEDSAPSEARSQGSRQLAQAVLILPRQPSEPYKRWGYLWQEGFLNEFTEMDTGERLVLSPGKFQDSCLKPYLPDVPSCPFPPVDPQAPNRSIPARSLGAACQNLWMSQDITVQSRLANLPKESWANAQDAKPVGSCVGEESPLSPQSSQNTVE
ncbi:Vascular Non-Inflammatory Molecule 2 [Manis pentadactyla]|nr:Vascular Non-Inflammatory Molecule 2 [Manis pentadactyla]